MTIHQYEAASRPARVEVDLLQLRRNFAIINRDKPATVDIMAVVKDQAYGHGAVAVARVAIDCGVKYLAVATIGEAIELRQAGIQNPVLVFGERTPDELNICLENNLTCLVNDALTLERYSELARSNGKNGRVHVKVDSGLSRYGIQWTEALPLVEQAAAAESIELEGVMSHFAMSDEKDKSFALQQLGRFRDVLDEMDRRGLRVPFRHMCNTGGYLDLPQAHFDLVRTGILPLGIYPSQACRRIEGLQPIMSVKTKVAALKDIKKGDFVGYGMRYCAHATRRIAVLPIGYGDGYPRVRNEGSVLIHGQRAPIIGGNAMDAMMVDVTDILETKQWDEVVLMGKQGEEEIDVHELASLKGSVSYDIMTGWSWRLPRVYLA